MKKIPVVALCGFLGSGKTTLLRKWSRDKELIDAAFIVHDLSELGVDAGLLVADDTPPEAGRLVGRVAALHGEHAGRLLSCSLERVFSEIAELEQEASVVLTESTGAARPWPLIKALTQDNRFFLRHFIVTIDALNLHRDFKNGGVLLRESSEGEDPALGQAAEVLAEQLAFATVVILTKIDTVSKSVLEEQVRNIQKLQPFAMVALSAHAGVKPSQLENSKSPDLLVLSDRAQKLGLIDQTSTAQDIEASVFSDPRPFHPQRLHDVCSKHLGTGVYRTKGFVWLASRPGYAFLWQQSGSQISLELKGLWRAEIVKNQGGKLLPEELDHLNKSLENKHPEFGDRHNEITVIGLERDRIAFLAALQNALCTSEEIEAWKKGNEFFDPWPTIGSE